MMQGLTLLCKHHVRAELYSTCYITSYPNFEVQCNCESEQNAVHMLLLYIIQLKFMIFPYVGQAPPPQLCSWPARNVPAFHTLNMTMERCNDLLELVQTIEHFR